MLNIDGITLSLELKPTITKSQIYNAENSTRLGKETTDGVDSIKCFIFDFELQSYEINFLSFMFQFK